MPGMSEPCPILMKFWILCRDELNRLFMLKFDVLAPHGARKLLVAYATSRLDQAPLKTCLVAYATTRLGHATFFPLVIAYATHKHILVGKHPFVRREAKSTISRCSKIHIPPHYLLNSRSHTIISPFILHNGSHGCSQATVAQ